MTLKRNIDYVADGYKSMVYDRSILRDHKVCMVVPGPSLDKEGIKWLEKNHEKFIIVAIGASLKKLYKHNIKPDIITSVDPFELTIKQFEFEDENYFDDTLLLCSTNTPDKIVNKFKKDNVFLYPILFNILFPFQSAMGGITIGEITYALCLVLGVGELYLVGADAALDQESGATHSKEHIHYKEQKLVKNELNEKNSITDDDIIEVKGNFREKVFTTRMYYSVIQFYNQFTADLKQDNQKIFNTADGARFNDIEPKKLEDIDLSHPVYDKKVELKKIKDKLDDFCVDSFEKHHVENAEHDIEILTKICDNIRKYKKLKFKNYDNFQYERLGLVIENIKLSKELRNHIFILYITNSFLEIMDNIIFDFFEKNPKLKSDEKHVKALNHYWVTPYEKIYKFFIELFKKYQIKKNAIVSI